MMGALLFCGAGDARAADLPPEVQAELSAATQQGLPAAPLEAKAREGLAKGVPPQRIAAVLADLRFDLELAVALVGDQPDAARRDDMVAAAATAISAGASPEGVRSLLELPADQRVAALNCLGDLVSLSLSEQSSVRLIRDVARSSNSQVRLNDLSATTASLLASGLSQEAVVSAVTESAHGQPTDHGSAGGHSNNGSHGNGSDGNNGNHGNGNNGNGGGNKD